MKNLQYIIFLLIFGCSSQSDKRDNPGTVETIDKTKNVDNTRYYTQQDTILIVTEIGDTLKYVKTNFNNIVDRHPEFFEQYPDNPDQAYFNSSDYEGFGGEAGKDTYYILYAYFLKQRNGIEEFAEQRQKLIEIYSGINFLFGQFQHGGTYFGHQHARILGYAEYSVFLMPKDKSDIIKTYDITKQKELYIKSLRQLIDDESKIDFNTQREEKVERGKRNNEVVDKLEVLITDNFYLRRAQEFHYGHYEYY